MRVLVDANILLRVAQPSSAFHQIACDALIALEQAGLELCLVPQSLYEYWVVATRPLNVNGLELPTSDVESLVTDLLQDFVLLRDERGIFEHWRDLVARYSVRGRPCHDTRLVAAMLRHRVQHLLTFDVSDFARYQEIRLHSPADILAGRLPV